MAQNSKPIRLIVGLGNPGTEYSGTRHNMGFDFVDDLARAQRAFFNTESKFFGEVAKAHFGDSDVWLLKPTTYMNLSGNAVQALASYYKIAPEEILVAHDELDIAPGCLKVKQGGGNAGHNGLKDITAKLGTADFWRLRIGIGHPRIFCPQQQVYDWVLGHPSPEHRTLIDEARQAALKTAEDFASGNFQKAERAVKKFANPRPAPTEADVKNKAESVKP